MAVITNHDDGAIPLALKAKLRCNISTKLDSLRVNTYHPGDIESVLESVSKKKLHKKQIVFAKA